MLRLSRTTTGLALIVALLSALTAWDGCADQSETSPLDLIGSLTVPRPRGDPRQEQALQVDVLHRSRQLQEVTEEVVAGRLSLLDAAGRMRDFQSASPYFNWERFRESHPAGSDDERFCRMVIDLAYPLGLKDEPQREAVARRLEAELEEHLRRGTLRLPER